MPPCNSKEYHYSLMPSFVSKGFINFYAIFSAAHFSFAISGCQAPLFSFIISYIILLKYFINIYQIHGEYNSEKN